MGAVCALLGESFEANAPLHDHCDGSRTKDPPGGSGKNATWLIAVASRLPSLDQAWACALTKPRSTDRLRVRGRGVCLGWRSAWAAPAGAVGRVEAVVLAAIVCQRVVGGGLRLRRVRVGGSGQQRQ